MSDTTSPNPDTITMRELSGVLQVLLQHTEQSMVLLDRDGVVCLWNPASEVLFGYRSDEMLGRGDTLLIPSDRLHETEQLRQRAWNGEGLAGVETERLNRQGTRIPVHVTLCPLGTDDGTVAGVVEVARPLARQAGAVVPSRVDEDAWERADREIARLLVDLHVEVDGGSSMVGSTPGMVQLRRHIARLGPTQATVLILGESGTGKELVARSLHEASCRAQGPFVAVNCASIPRDLLESDLFGHERGAFTGAFRRKIGRLEAAAGGTVFLDEICEMPLELQPKLLRVLEERVLTRVGGLEEIALDVRFLAATNRSIEVCVREGRFRQDLFYRLGAARVTVPPLRARLGDLEALCEALLARIAQRHGLSAARLAVEVMDLLRGHGWPGNVRELANVLEQARLVSEGEVITADVVAPLLQGESDVGRAPATTASATRSLAEVEAEHIRCVLEAVRWNKTEAARILGVGRDTLYRKMRRHGLR